MKKYIKIILYILGAVLALLVVLVLAVGPVVNSALVKSEIEGIFDKEFDMNLKIMGLIDIDFFPKFSITTHNVHVFIPTGQIGSAEKIIIEVRLLDLLFLSLRLQNVAIHDPELTFDSLAFDKLMAWGKTEASEFKPVQSFSIEAFSISNAKFHYANDDTLIDLKNINISGGSLNFIADRKSVVDDVVSFLKGIYFRGDFSATEISSLNFKLENIRATVKGQYGLLTADPVELKFLGAQTQLRTVLDLTATETTLASRLVLTGLNIEPLARQFYSGSQVKGNLNIIADIFAAEIDMDRILAGKTEEADSAISYANDRLPVKSLKLDAFNVAGTGISYLEGTTSVDFKQLDLVGDQLQIISNHQFLVEDFEAFIKAALLKGKAAGCRISVPGHTFKNMLAKFSIDRGILNAETIEMSYLDSRAKLSGRMDLNRAKPHFKLHLSSSGLNLSSFARKFYPQVDAKGKLSIDAGISATDIELNKLLGNLKKASQPSRSIASNTVPVKSIKVDTFRISGKNLSFSINGTALDIATLALTTKPLIVIQNHNLVLTDVDRFLRFATFKGNTTISRLAAQNLEFENILAELSGDRGFIKSELLELTYMGFRTKLTGTVDLTKKTPDLNLHVESSGPDIKPLVEQLSPDFAVKGNLSIKADIHTVGLEMDNLIEKLQTVSESDKPFINEVLPVKDVIVTSFRASARNIGLARDTFTLDDADLDLSGEQLSVIENSRFTIGDFKRLLRAARFVGKTRIHNISIPNHKFDNIRFSLLSDQGILKGEPIELDYFGAPTIIKAFLNMREDVNQLEVRIEMPEVDLEQFLEFSEDSKIASGVLNINSDLEVRTASFDELLKNTKGVFSIRGQNLMLKNVDLDKLLNEFKKMRGYGFYDFAALLFLGPLGPIVSRGFEQMESLKAIKVATGDSKIQQLNSDWNVTGGVLRTEDVAFSTQQHRVAVQGEINIPKQKYMGVTIAMVDEKGCIINSETVDGSFDDPKVKDTGFVERTMIRPLLKWLDPKCKFFYNGKVSHPSKQR